MAVRGSVLLYNFTDKARIDKVKFIFVLMGIRIKTVEKEDYRKPIGVLAGVPGMAEEAENRERIEKAENDRQAKRELFSDEMLVICHLTDAQMDRMLSYFRKEGIQIPLKAALTPVNQHWNSLELHAEIMREHIEMQKRIAERREAEKAGGKGAENAN